MPIDPAFVADLVCPQTHEPLRIADAAALERVNAAIRAGQAKNRGGDVVGEPLEEGLVPESGTVIYPVRDEIPILLVGEAIPLESGSGSEPS